MGHLILQRAFKGIRDVTKGFTLLELLVVLTVLLILSSFGMYLYHRSLAYAKDTVCQTNLRAMQESIIFYTAENEALPGTLGDLKLDHVERGYAKAMEGRRWLVKACSLLIKFDASDHAYATFLTYDNLKKYGATEKIFHCPGDHNGGASYGINGELQGKRWSEVNEHAIVVADCDSWYRPAPHRQPLETHRAELHRDAQHHPGVRFQQQRPGGDPRYRLRFR